MKKCSVCKDIHFTRMNNEVDRRFRFELRDKILNNMNLDDVPNIDIIAKYLDKLSIAQLIDLYNIAEILDWQHVGRIIGVVGETYKEV